MADRSDHMAYDDCDDDFVDAVGYMLVGTPRSAIESYYRKPPFKVGDTVVSCHSYVTAPIGSEHKLAGVRWNSQRKEWVVQLAIRPYGLTYFRARNFKLKKDTKMEYESFVTRINVSTIHVKFDGSHKRYAYLYSGNIEEWLGRTFGTQRQVVVVDPYGRKQVVDVVSVMTDTVSSLATKHVFSLVDAFDYYEWTRGEAERAKAEKEKKLAEAARKKRRGEIERELDSIANRISTISKFEALAERDTTGKMDALLKELRDL